MSSSRARAAAGYDPALQGKTGLMTRFGPHDQAEVAQKGASAGVPNFHGVASCVSDRSPPTRATTVTRSAVVRREPFGGTLSRSVRAVLQARAFHPYARCFKRQHTVRMRSSAIFLLLTPSVHAVL